jgi:formiminotetrahydrofolate cyclodeaminase
VTEPSQQPLADFLSSLASEAPTPGGGTAAAVAGAMGAALTEMVVALTLAREKYASAHAAVRPIGEAARAARAQFLVPAHEDAEAYEDVVTARRLPKATDAEKAQREEALAVANRRATEVPMRTAQLGLRLLAMLPELVESGNPNAASDAGAAALLLEAAAQGALLNVGINLPGVADAQFVTRMQRETADLQENAQRLRSHVLAAVRKRF